MEIKDLLEKAKRLSISKKGKEADATGTCAISKSGRIYSSGLVASDTNLFDIPSELGALVQAVHVNDFAIERLVTLSESKEISPLVLKIIADYEARVGHEVAYEIKNTNNETTLETASPTQFLNFYTSSLSQLSKTSSATFGENIVKEDTNNEEVLKKYALLGLERNFPTESGSSYGSTIATSDGEIIFGGQYSTKDKRLGLHAEMAVAIDALMQEKRSITHVAVISTKFKDEPCEMCGVCRQFWFELCTRFNLNPVFLSFAQDSSAVKRYSIEELLPHPWTSKKW